MASIALLVSLDATQDDVLRTVKGELEEQLRNEQVDLKLLRDVKDLFKKLKKLPEKLSKTLEKAKIVVVITSPTVCSINNQSDLRTALNKLKELDGACANIVVEFIEGERRKGGGSKLLLISLEDVMKTSEFFKDVQHLSGMLKGNSEGIARWIAGKCR